MTQMLFDRSEDRKDVGHQSRQIRVSVESCAENLLSG